ncbi:CLUMA_CG019891, isoform A [Clunio marinus]|uniref:CLUMA_CG019891, isoform A n=1 Tax=Clunio marinus TaxID=568069 RepID=A0A1J1J3X9_9DIPT|nr:CLUMA_CG019891, isoform A [Clunio marinus]
MLIDFLTDDDKNKEQSRRLEKGFKFACHIFLVHLLRQNQFLMSPSTGIDKIDLKIGLLIMAQAVLLPFPVA